MKKIFGFIFILGLSFTVASCNNNNKDPNENDGRYAIYKLAQDSNYPGTYEEWLASIKGDQVELSVIDNSLKWKVIIGLITGLVILVFIILNLMLKIASQKRKLVDAEERALRATSKRSKYLVEKPGIKTVVPNQKIDKKPKNDVDIKSVTSTGYDDMQIDLTDSVKEEFEKGAAIKDNFKDGKKEDTKVNKMPQAKEADNKKSEVSGDKKPENKVTPVKAAESKPVAAKAVESKPTPAKEEDDFDDDGFEFIMIDDE